MTRGPRGPFEPAPGNEPILDEAFDRARLDLPSETQLRALAARLPVAPPVGPPSSAAPTVSSGLATAAASTSLVKAGLALVIAGAVAALGYQVVPRSGPVAPAVPAAAALAATDNLRPGPLPAVVPAPNAAPIPRNVRAPRSGSVRSDPPKRNTGPSPRRPGLHRPALDPSPAPDPTTAIAAPPPAEVAAPAPLAGPIAEVAPPATAEPDEIALLLAAQRAVSTDPGQALVLLEEHRRRFAAGELVQERELIVIDALTRLGRRQDARERVRAFRRQFPTSAHLDRLESLDARVRR